MAEYEPGMRSLLPVQYGELRRIISRVQIPEGVKTLDGCFPILDRRDGTRRVIFYRDFIGSSESQLYTAGGRIRARYERVSGTGNRRTGSAALMYKRMRVVDLDYSGVCRVGQSGWVLLNIINPENRQKLLTDDLYEESLIRASAGIDPNIESEAPCILLHPDYRNIGEVRVITFDPLVENISADISRQLKPPLDAIVLDMESRFIPKRVVRMLTGDQWGRI